MELPTDYTKLDWRKGETRLVREEYAKRQNGQCMFCGNPLDENPHDSVLTKVVNWDLFPPGFQKHPVHLQHNHYTGMTEGAVHMQCNAVMWEYYGR